jgi:DNA-directed RNA polymerase subunit beta
MDQTNPLAELTHKRTLSRAGSRAVCAASAPASMCATFTFSHYGRICPIETPEGPNIGLIGSWRPMAASTSTASSRRPTAR